MAEIYDWAKDTALTQTELEHHASMNRFVSKALYAGAIAAGFNSGVDANSLSSFSQSGPFRVALGVILVAGPAATFWLGNHFDKIARSQELAAQNAPI